MTFFVSRFFIRIANDQNIDWFQIIRECKLRFDYIRFEITNPDRTEAQIRSFQHHMIGQNRSVNIGSDFAIKRSFPYFRMICAHDDCERCMVYVGCLSDFI